MRSTVRIVAGGLALATAAVLSLAGPATAAPEYPAPTGRCVDEVGVLGSGVCADVTEILLRDERDTSDEIAVAVVPSTGEATIEAWSTGLFNTWGVGKKAKNNGVLLVVAVDDRRVRLATGRGLAKRLDDRAAGEIIDKTVTPQFAEQEYAVGILTGLDEVRRRLGHTVAGHELAALAAPDSPGSPGSPADPVAQPVGQGTVEEPVFLADDPGFAGEVSDEDSSVPVGTVLMVGLALIAIVGFAVSGRSRPGRTHHDDHRAATRWQSSSSHTSFGSSDSGSSSSSDFGGGSSSGSGASGSW